LCGHNHASAAARHRPPLYIVLILIGASMAAEAVGSLVSSSLALMADAHISVLITLSLTHLREERGYAPPPVGRGGSPGEAR